VPATGREPISCNRFPSSPGYLTFFNPSNAPESLSESEGVPVVVGTRFMSTSPGYITAIRWFKSSDELWEGHRAFIYQYTNGALVAQAVDFTDRSCPGPSWVIVPLTRPMEVPPNAQFVAVVEGMDFYTRTEGYFGRVFRNGSLAVPANAGLIGRSRGAMPRTQSATNYFVDSASTRPCPSAHLRTSFMLTHSCQLVRS
jgi:hypothetical protein